MRGFIKETTFAAGMFGVLLTVALLGAVIIGAFSGGPSTKNTAKANTPPGISSKNKW